jgi:hypothetical protein
VVKVKAPSFGMIMVLCCFSRASIEDPIMGEKRLDKSVFRGNSQ